MEIFCQGGKEVGDIVVGKASIELVAFEILILGGNWWLSIVGKKKQNE